MENQAVILEKMITSLLNEKKYPSLRDILVTMNPSDIASVFGELEPDRIPLLFRLLPKEQAAETFVEMDPEAPGAADPGLFRHRAARKWWTRLYLDDAVDLVEEMPANVVRRILTPRLTRKARKSINELLRYPENSAGSIMTTEYVTLQPRYDGGGGVSSASAAPAWTKKQSTPATSQTAATLMGLVTVKDLLLAEDDEHHPSNIMETPCDLRFHPGRSGRSGPMFAKYNFLALPVVDNENRLVGIVTFDDAMDVMEEEATEDMENDGRPSCPSDKPYMPDRRAWRPVQAPHPVAAAPDGFRHVHRHASSPVLKMPWLRRWPSTVFHPHADGHRRQLRLPVLRDRHSGPVPGRAGIPGPASSDLEGNPDRAYAVVPRWLPPAFAKFCWWTVC